VAIDAAPTKPPTIDELVAEITAAREELLTSVEALKGQFTPESIRQRGLSLVTGVFTDEFGGIKPKRVAIVVGVVVGVVGLRLLTRRRR
jgi:hypothetical protein